MARPIKNKVLAAKKLVKECESLIFSGEWEPYTLRKIEELTRADLDLVITYCNYYIQHQTIGGLMPPQDKVYHVLKTIDIVEEIPWLFL